jgi:hypothetical protein
MTATNKVDQSMFRLIYDAVAIGQETNHRGRDGLKKFGVPDDMFPGK